MTTSTVIVTASPTDARARAALADYFRDIVGRYFDRPATDQDVVEALADFPSDDLEEPTGALLLATRGSETVGCAGLRWSGLDEAELVRVWTCPPARRLGVAAQLIGAAETVARDSGRPTMWLEVRADLIEAQALYRSLGYKQTSPFSDGRLREARFEKSLSGDAVSG